MPRPLDSFFGDGRPAFHFSGFSRLYCFYRFYRYFAPVYALLIVYATLHPFSGWETAKGLSPFLFLNTRWPLYWTKLDVVFNVAAYAPLGFLFAPLFRKWAGRRQAFALTCVFAGVLSFCLETLQTYLPSRVPSNLDLACNLLGAALGAFLAVWPGDRLADGLVELRSRLFASHPLSEAGIAVLALWLLAQFSPAPLLFGTGNLRPFFDIALAVPALAIPYTAPALFALETGAVACHTVAIGLFAASLQASELYPSRLSLLVFFGGAIALHSLASAILTGPARAHSLISWFSWMTPGAQLGLAAGFVVLFPTLRLTSSSRLSFAGLALIAGTALVNLAPASPYAAAMGSWNQGHFLNFNGLTRLVSSLWPFLALPYLIVLKRK